LSRVRLRYTGLVDFASRLFSFAAGLAFTLIVTRTISETEFGVWNNIGDLLGYFIIAYAIIPFWAGRFTAREHKGAAKTGVISNLLLSLIFFVFYLALIPLLTSILQTSAYLTLYLLTSLLILEHHTLAALENILHAKKPHLLGYGLVIYESCKVAISVILAVWLKLGLMGAICATVASYLIQVLFYLKPLANELKEKFEWSYLKEWIKASPINLYGIVGSRLESLTLILLFAYGGQLARAYYGAAQTIAYIIGYSQFLALALYPRLLMGSSSEDVSASLRMVLMFATPMTFGALALSDSYMTILSVAYAEARPILLLLALNTLCLCLSAVFETIVSGTERLDAKAKIPFRKLLRSKLFLIFTLPYLQSIITLPAAFVLLTSNQKTPLMSATYIAAIALLANIVMLAARYTIAHKSFAFKFPWRSTSKYVLASAVMASLLLVVPHPTTVSKTVVLTLIGAGTYFATLTPIDRETRTLIRLVLREVRSKKA